MNPIDTDPPPPTACFTYGSLMCEDIMAAVCGAHAAYRPATLQGHRRHAVVGVAYPGMVPNADHRVQGVLYLELPDSAWPRLDAFEGEEYERRIVTVETDGGAHAQAWTYVFRPRFAHRLAPADWDFDHFLRVGKARFMADYVGFDTLQPR
ncbi:gamma-glutamylcyclotransferase family protein [Thauera sp. WH-1]|uniref:gamma-glutamylcyclotransferase family protein n=1 Tax=Thauera sp. WH-1 TaxID=3398230 RepID=UPI0039FD2EAB